MKHYFESLFNENLTFVLGWEAFVLFMLLMFISIIVRLNRIEKKTNVMQSYLDDIIEELE
jgi:hypothetical protein|tara:strand:- start:261 stop:440 length:180 start_codon:yes stop_codon:yes gene_type:complete